MTHPTEPATDSVASVALLGDPVRRRVYAHVSAAPGPVDRDSTAAAAGISRALAAFHLDRLVEGGLLEASFRRRTGRAGPGAGRPAKFYARPLGVAIDVTLPPRRYDVAAQVFAAALERAGGPPSAVLAAARDLGRSAAEAVPARVRSRSRAGSRAAMLGLLRDRGFEPRELADGGIGLGNCPFQGLTAKHRELTCGANLALLSGVVDRFGSAGLVAERGDPPAPCCVALRPVSSDRTLGGTAPTP